MSINLHAITIGDRAEFDLQISDVQYFHSAEIVRLVPGQRIVSRGTWNNQQVYAKIFIGKRAKRHAERDLRGATWLSQAAIATPSILYAGNLEQGFILLYEAITDSRNAEEYWLDESSPVQRLQLARRLVAEVARHHAAGLLQTDLYLKNFLLQDTRVYTLDGDGIRRLPPILPHAASLDNLALLLSKFDVLELENWLDELLQTYADVISTLPKPDVQSMVRRIARHRINLMREYSDHKVLRSCTDVWVEKSPRYYLAVTRKYLDQALLSAVQQPDRLLQKAEQRLKNGNTCTVGLAEIGGREVVVKRYNIKNFLHGLGRATRTTRARISWSNAHRLMVAGIATASPIALLEKRFGFIRRQAFFLAEYVDAPDAGEFFADAAIAATQKHVVADNIASLFYKLYLLRLTHGDFKASNVKIVDAKPLLIDLDSMRMRRCGCLFARQHVRDLRRFMRNWQNDVAVTALLAQAFQGRYKNKELLQKAGIVL